jgi:hypothetical protein
MRRDVERAQRPSYKMEGTAQLTSGCAGERKPADWGIRQIVNGGDLRKIRQGWSEGLLCCDVVERA